MHSNSLIITPERVARCLATQGLEAQATWGDEGRAPAGIPARLTPAAVLVPLINRASGVTVLLTQRTDHLSDHAGQISFPGGRAEQHDSSMEETALRETEEEIGLPRNQVELLGALPVYHTITGYRVTPIVGWVEPPLALDPDPFEVAEVFEVPLAFLLNPANHQRHSIVRDGQPHQYYAMPYQDRYIWGATAGMLIAFYQAWNGVAVA